MALVCRPDLADPARDRPAGGGLPDWPGRLRPVPALELPGAADRPAVLETDHRPEPSLRRRSPTPTISSPTNSSSPTSCARFARAGRVHRGRAGTEPQLHRRGPVRRWPFIVDVRLENRSLHLLYKALFELSTDRADFVSRLFSRGAPADLDRGARSKNSFPIRQRCGRSGACERRTDGSFASGCSRPTVPAVAP